MCGIVGLFDTRGKKEIDRELLGRLNQVQIHRGPDEGELYTEPGIGLGHRRLSIMDVSSGQQPLFNEDGSFPGREADEGSIAFVAGSVFIMITVETNNGTPHLRLKAGMLFQQADQFQTVRTFVFIIQLTDKSCNAPSVAVVLFFVMVPFYT